MAKVKQNDFIGTVNEVIGAAKEAGVVHLHAGGDSFNGRKIQIGGQEHFHFGTTGYLGLEQDRRLKQAAIKAIDNYGTQFPLSKSYISHPLYAALEDRVEEMYRQPVIITKNSTLGHIAVIPSIVGDDDGVILDHQVHWSVQNATQILKTRGVQVEMIRHNSMNMLEDKIKKMSSKTRKIWYMADGVYSMYGDYAPVPDLIQLAKKYSQLQIYFDDVHGMSWNGKNGCGYISSVLGELPENVVLISTLSKTFGASGAVVVCADKKLHSRIKTFGGPLTFSAQLEPASVAAAIASADIHLSPEIYSLQAELQERISYFNQLLEETELPLIDKNNSPVFYIGTGMPVSGYNFVQRLLRDGFYVNLGLFPAVPVKNTGVRITISRHNRKEDIKALVDAMVHHHPRSLLETGGSLSKIFKAFRMPFVQVEQEKQNVYDLTLQVENSVNALNKEEWDKMFAGKGVLDWRGQAFLEKVYSNNKNREHNWEFKYIIIKDRLEKVVLATSLSYALWKDDLLAPASTSLKVEEQRKTLGPYYLTSPVLSTGSIFTEGDHLFIDEDHPQMEEALKMFLDKLEDLDHKHFNSAMTVLRDFPEDTPLNGFFHDRGFIKVNMPESSVYENFEWEHPDEFIATLSRRSRRHFQRDIASYVEKFEVKFEKSVEKHLLPVFSQLHENVRQNNPGLNTFPFPEKIFEIMNEDTNWEFILLYLKEKHEENPYPVGVMFCYLNATHTYVPEFIGMDYRYARKFNVYRQLLYQTILRAKSLGFHKIDFGLTAAFEKRKLGARVIPKVCYVQAKDNFSLELLETMQTSR